MEPLSHSPASGRSFSMPTIRHNPRPITSPLSGQPSTYNNRSNSIVSLHIAPIHASNASPPSNGLSNRHPEGVTNSRALLTSALEEAQNAVQLDHLGKTTAALESYRRATVMLATAMQVSASVGELHRLQNIVSKNTGHRQLWFTSFSASRLCSLVME